MSVRFTFSVFHQLARWDQCRVVFLEIPRLGCFPIFAVGCSERDHFGVDKRPTIFASDKISCPLHSTVIVADGVFEGNANHVKLTVALSVFRSWSKIPYCAFGWVALRMRIRINCKVIVKKSIVAAKAKQVCKLLSILHVE